MVSTILVRGKDSIGCRWLPDKQQDEDNAVVECKRRIVDPDAISRKEQLDCGELLGVRSAM